MEHKIRAPSMESLPNQSGPTTHESTPKCRRPSTIVTKTMLKSVISATPSKKKTSISKRFDFSHCLLDKKQEDKLFEGTQIEDQVRSVSDTAKSKFQESTTENLKLPNIEQRIRSLSMILSPLPERSRLKCRQSSTVVTRAMLQSVRSPSCSKTSMSETFDVRYGLLDKKEDEKALRRSSLFEGTPLAEQTRSVSDTTKPKPQGISTENLKLPDIRHRTRSMESSSTRPVTLKLKCQRSSTVVTTEMLQSVRSASTSKKKTSIMSETFDFSHCLLDRKGQKDCKSYENIGSSPEMSRAEKIEIYSNRILTGIDNFEDHDAMDDLLMQEKYERHSDFGDIVPRGQISNDSPATIYLEPSKAEWKRKNSMLPVGSGSLVLEGWIRSPKRGSTASNYQ